MNNPRDIQAYSTAEKLLQSLVALHRQTIDKAYCEQYQQVLMQLVDCSNFLGNYALKYFCFHMLDNLSGISSKMFAVDSKQFALFSQWPQMQLRYLQESRKTSALVFEVLEFLCDQDWYYPLDRKDSDWLLNIGMNPYDREILKSSIGSRNATIVRESSNTISPSEMGKTDQTSDLHPSISGEADAMDAHCKIPVNEITQSSLADKTDVALLSGDPLLAALNESAPSDSSVTSDLFSELEDISKSTDCGETDTSISQCVVSECELEQKSAEYEYHRSAQIGVTDNVQKESFSAESEDDAQPAMNNESSNGGLISDSESLDVLLGSQSLGESDSVTTDDIEALFNSVSESESSEDLGSGHDHQQVAGQNLNEDFSSELTTRQPESVDGKPAEMNVPMPSDEGLIALFASNGKEADENQIADQSEELFAQSDNSMQVNGVEDSQVEVFTQNNPEKVEIDQACESTSFGEMIDEGKSFILDDRTPTSEFDNGQGVDALFASQAVAEEGEQSDDDKIEDPFTHLNSSVQRSVVTTDQEIDPLDAIQQMFDSGPLDSTSVTAIAANSARLPGNTIDDATIESEAEFDEGLNAGEQSAPAHSTDAELHAEKASVPSEEVEYDQDTDDEVSAVAQVLEDDSANELLSLIIMEVQQLAVQVEQRASQAGAVESHLSLEQIHDYSEELNRIGAASEMIGMHAMHTVCMHVEENLNHWAENYPANLAALGNALPIVLRLVEEYLGSPDKSQSYQKLVEYFKSDLWPVQMSAGQIDDLCDQFGNFVIEIEASPLESTPRHAQLEDLSIDIPEDVNAAVLDGMLQELPGQMETLSAAVIALRDDDYMHNLEVAKRTAHTLKGAANTVGIKGIANLTHTMEDVFETLFRASRKPIEAMHRSLVDTADLLEQMAECLLGYGDETDDALGRYQRLLDWACDIDQVDMPSEEPRQPIEATQQPVEKPAEVKQKVSETKETATSVRSTDAIIDELLDFSGEQIILTTQMQDKVSASNQLLRSLKKGNQKIQELTDEFEHLVEIKNIAARSNFSLQNGEFDPLEVDQFNELRTFGRRLMEACADNAEIMDALTNRVHAITDDCTQNLQLHTHSQKRLIQSSMVPVSTLVPRLRRALRQANSATGKSAQLEIIGEHTLIDRRMMTVLGDSLLHLVRNAVDHGIEPADLRVASGKSDFGTVTLAFIAHEDQVLVRCSDDGAGLSVRNIAAKAKRLGLINEDEELDQEQATALILQHGFSTRDEATQLSGRGVGLDNVHAGLLEVNGSMRVTSQPGEGTQVEMHFPANLLYAQVLLVESGAEIFAVSTRGLEEILPASAGSVRQTATGFEFDMEDHRRALYSLSQLLEYAAEPDVSPQSMLLTLRGVDDKVRLVNVDTILRSTEAVIKPLSRYLPRVQGVIGSTVLGDGRLVTVLDLQGLMIRYSEVGQRSIHEIHTNIPVAPSRRVLIAEDSVSTRRALEELCRDLGYETRSAIDGVDATALLQEYQPDVLITDLEMPRMNGFELVSHVRSNPAVSSTPVIMLTSRSTEKHRNEATRVGVDAYLTKPFSEEQLQEYIEQLLNENGEAEQNVSVR